MTKLVNRAKMTTASTGTGSPITLGSAVDGYQTFAAAGVADADVVRYVIEDGDAWEIGLGTYTASGTTLTRGSIESSNADNAINLTGNAVVYVSAAAADLQELVDFADNFVLPTADGSTGQVLTTNGAGTLSFTTISGYTDADVDTHLNTSTASSGEVLSWTGSDYDWIAAPAALTGQTDSASPFETSLGVGAGAVNTGDWATFIGYQAGERATSGVGNTGIGFQSLRGASPFTGSRNTAVGEQTGENLSTGANNTFLGSTSGFSATTGSDNVGVGRRTLLSLTTGSNNVAIGNGALDAATTGGRNIAIGQGAMGLGVATSSTGDNIGIGYFANYRITSAANNIALGRSSLSNATTGGSNLAIGTFALTNNSTGTNNVAIGQSAGQEALNSNNVFLGHQAGDATTTGSNQIVIGQGSDASSATVSNEITLGNSSITNLRVPGVGFQFDTTDGLIVPKTITAGGTTGAQTINKTAGSVNFAAAATSLVVTNSFVDANSVIIATVATNDTTMTSVRAVAAAGSFTLYANAAATAETRVNWFVAN